MAVEGEYPGARFQWLGRCRETVRANAEAGLRRRDPHLLEAALGEPPADSRHQIWLEPAAGPHHRAAVPAQLCAEADRALHVGVAHVAEHAADQYQAGGRQSGIRIGQRRVPGDDLDLAEPGPRRGLAGDAGVAFVEFDQAGRDVVAPPVTGEDRDDVPALPGAHAHRAERAGRRGVERDTDLLLDRG